MTSSCESRSHAFHGSAKTLSRSLAAVEARAVRDASGRRPKGGVARVESVVGGPELQPLAPEKVQRERDENRVERQRDEAEGRVASWPSDALGSWAATSAALAMKSRISTPKMAKTRMWMRLNFFDHTVSITVVTVGLSHSSFSLTWSSAVSTGRLARSGHGTRNACASTPASLSMRSPHGARAVRRRRGRQHALERRLLVVDGQEHLRRLLELERAKRLRDDVRLARGDQLRQHLDRGVSRSRGARRDARARGGQEKLERAHVAPLERHLEDALVKGRGRERELEQRLEGIAFVRVVRALEQRLAGEGSKNVKAAG